MKPSDCQKCGSDHAAFTLIELLVVIFIIGILTGLLFSAVVRVKSNVQTTICSANLRQVGIGFFLYADDHEGMLPEPLWKGLKLPWISYLAYRVDPSIRDVQSRILEGPWNLARLIEARSISDPSVFYCPGQSTVRHKETGGFPYHFSTYRDADHSWPWTSYGGENVRTSYMYIPQKELAPQKRTHIPLTNLAVKASHLSPRRTIVTDLFHSPEFFPHKSGKNVAKFSALYGDGRVSIKKPEKSFFDIYQPNPDITEMEVSSILSHFNE